VRSEDTTRRRLAFVLLVVVGLALWPGRAWADTPDRQPIPTEDLAIPSGACPFPVSFHVVTNNEHTITWFDAEGNPVRTIIQGQVVLEITNTETGTSVIRNVSGPGTITFADLLFVGRGSQLFFFFPDELGPGTPGSMFINRGRVVEYLGEPRKIISQTGVQEDLCATLSASPDSEASGAETSEIPGSEASEAEVSESQVPSEDPPEVPPVKLL
jgi:hypothetical protein